MSNLTYGEAIKEAIELEMKKKTMVFLAGEDVAKLGGAFGVTSGLYDEFGPGVFSIRRSAKRRS